ncbi:hypothetical protein CYY_005246 [Polysphondylium violaceum]|uniref:GRIP domain-containing protein n=1 Tax=Polysphondylium violaceum TaxID=133409 RepID=A0A8J4PVC6_9MYCE|nr:hypothetical protein CYY_005246 [Polysphondylium violaceum]
MSSNTNNSNSNGKINNMNGNNSNNGGNNGGLASGLIGKSWMSLSEQFSQIKDVMTSNDHEYDQDIDDEEDQEDQMLMLRTENIKYKDDIAELEKTIQQLQQRESSISKEYSNIINEKHNEISELKKINDHLKSSLLSNVTTSPTTTTTTKGEEEEEEEKEKEKKNQQKPIDTSSLGILTDHDDLIDSSSSDLHDQHVDSQKLKEEYQNQILSLQELHQEKLYNLTISNQQLEEKVSKYEENQTKMESDMNKLQNTIDTLQKQLLESNNTISNIASSKEQQSAVAPSTTTATTTNNEADNNLLKEQLAKSNKELTRLRQHLLDMEEQHTTLDLENEERIGKLEQELKLALEQSSNQTVTNDKVNQLLSELAEKEEELKRTNVTLSNLNRVLEQFQADQEVAIQTETVHLQKKLEDTNALVDALKKDKQEAEKLSHKYMESVEKIAILESTIQMKVDEYIKLKEDIEPLKAAFDKNILRLGDMCLQEQESVDKRVVSKLILTYLRSGKSNRSEILELIAKILNFSESEKLSIGLNKKSQWSLIPFFGGAGNNLGGEGGEKPVTEMWIEFLLKESEDKSKAENQNNNIDDDNIGGSLSNVTPMSTPTKQNPYLQAPPPSPSTPFKSINNNYFSVTPNGKHKSTVIYDGDMNDTPFK